MQPPWNTFWGTADESMNFTVGGNILYICHQGTLSGFNVETGELFVIGGNRDTWGGVPSVPWARNEWHGPGRGSVAISGNRLYWMTGSRVIAIEGTVEGRVDQEVETPALPMTSAPVAHHPATSTDWRAELAEHVESVIGGTLAPLYVEIGLAGREFAFAHSSETFRALSKAYPHLDAPLQERVRNTLAREWQAHPPYSSEGFYPLDQGERRELFVCRRTCWSANAVSLNHTPSDGWTPFCSTSNDSMRGMPLNAILR